VAPSFYVGFRATPAFTLIEAGGVARMKNCEFALGPARILDGGTAFRRLLHAMKEAESLCVATYSFDPEWFRRNVVSESRAPRLRHVSLLLPRDPNVMPDYEAMNRLDKELRKRRVQLKLRVADRLHAKVAITGNTIGPTIGLIGSSNMTSAGFGDNTELNAVVDGLSEDGSTACSNLQNWFDSVFEKSPESWPPLHQMSPPMRPARSAQEVIGDGALEEESVPLSDWYDTTLVVGRSSTEWVTEPAPLWDHQQEVLDELRSVRWQTKQYPKRRIAIILPVAAGKTRIAAEYVKDQLRKMPRDKRKPRTVIWLAHTRKLVQQAYGELRSVIEYRSDLGCSVGLRMGREKSPGWDEAQVLCTTYQTAARLGGPKAELVVADECHHERAHRYRQISRERMKRGGRLLGLTATPYRLDGEDLQFRRIPDPEKSKVTYRDLLRRKRLAKPAYRAVKTGCNMGVLYARRNSRAFAEFEKGVLEGSSPVNSSHRNSTIAAWMGRNRKRLGKTLVFAATRQHCADLGRALRSTMPEESARVNWLFTSGGAPDISPSGDIGQVTDEFKDLNPEEFSALVVCRLYVEGFDCPDVKTIVLARPTLSPSLWHQMAGRGARSNNGRKSAFNLVEFVDEYEVVHWDALRASYYILHANGYEWWRENIWQAVRGDAEAPGRRWIDMHNRKTKQWFGD